MPQTPPNPPQNAIQVVVGWRERVGLPDWGIRHLKAKIDTGARTSALHVANIEETPGDDHHVRFEVVVREARPARNGRPALDRLTRWVQAELVREAIVKPSSGHRQTRPVVRTRLRLGRVEHEIEVTLVSRKGMLCRMLVGRSALAGRYAVDPQRSFSFGNRLAQLVDFPEPPPATHPPRENLP